MSEFFENDRRFDLITDDQIQRADERVREAVETFLASCGQFGYQGTLADVFSTPEQALSYMHHYQQHAHDIVGADAAAVRVMLVREAMVFVVQFARETS